MEKRIVVRYLAVYLIFVALIAGLVFLKYASLTGFAVFEQNEGTEFGEGTYNNTEYSSSAVRLSSGNLTGTYTSKIFDAGNDAVWNFLSYTGTEPDVNFIFAVDNSADVWKSSDSGTTWAKTNDDYNGADGNGVTASFFDSSKNHFIVYNQDVWKSTDSGVTWIKVNDDYNGAEGQNAYVATIDKNNYIYIIEGDQDVWKSSDSGVSWSKISADFNGGNGNFFGMGVDSYNVLYAVDNQADIWKSNDGGASWSLVKDDYNAGAGNNANGMAIDSNNNIYVLDIQDVWESIDSGVTWTKVNDDFNGAGDAENGWAIAVDSNNYVYVVDGGEDVFKSTDSGSTFTKTATNFNGASLSVPAMAATSETTSLSFQVRNCSLNDCSDASWKSLSLASLNLLGRYFQYKTSFASPDSSITPTLSNINIDYDLANSAPSINLINPSNGVSFGYNTSLALNFIASDVDNNIDVCWYNIDSGENIYLVNCQNITFDVSEGSHTLTIYVRDIYGLEASDYSNFTVSIGAPSISLSYPVNVYLTSYDITFRYTPADTDLSSCELWGFSANNFKKNQTNINPVSGAENTFILALQDGTYIWNVKCNDSQGNNAVNGNQTFTIDTINPNLILSEPSGSKSSRTVTASWNVSDANLDSCKYNVYRGVSIEIANTSVACNLSSVSFSVTLDADFIFNFYVNDSAGNENSSSLAFTVSTTSSGGSSGGGGGGRGTITPIIKEEAGLEVSGIGDVIMKPGESKTLSVTAKNIGAVFLNKCKLVGRGNDGLISSRDVKGLAAGQQEDFVFVLNAPEDSSGERILEIIIKCEEVEAVTSFNLLLTIDKIEVELISSEQSKGKFNFVYLVKEKTGKNHDVKVSFWLENSDGVRVSEGSDSFSLEGGQELERKASLDSSNDAGEYVLNLDLSSDGSVTSLSEPIIMGESAGLFGRAILVAGGGKILVIAIFIIILAFVVIYVVRRLIKKSLKEDRAGYVKVKLNKKH